MKHLSKYSTKTKKKKPFFFSSAWSLGYEMTKTCYFLDMLRSCAITCRVMKNEVQSSTGTSHSVFDAFSGCSFILTKKNQIVVPSLPLWKSLMGRFLKHISKLLVWLVGWLGNSIRWVILPPCLQGLNIFLTQHFQSLLGFSWQVGHWEALLAWNPPGFVSFGRPGMLSE